MCKEGMLDQRWHLHQQFDEWSYWSKSHHTPMRHSTFDIRHIADLITSQSGEIAVLLIQIEEDDSDEYEH
jgi:hypothetical protein